MQSWKTYSYLGLLPLLFSSSQTDFLSIAFFSGKLEGKVGVGLFKQNVVRNQIKREERTLIELNTQALGIF